MTISAGDRRRLFTKMLIAVYKEMAMPTNFLRSFFDTRESGSKSISIEVQRNSEAIAVDVLRGTEGNRNNMNRFSEKMFVPPYYREYFDATDLDFYDQLFGAGDMEMDEMTFQEWLQTAAEKVQVLQAKIERAIEKQCAEVLQTGILELKSGENIDFKRKAASKEVLVGADRWDQAGSNPITVITRGCKFLREQGKMQGGTVNMIVGSGALDALLDNSEFRERANLRRVALVDLSLPVRVSESVGATFHGTFSAGSWRVNLWTYPQVYEDSQKVSFDYIDTRNIVLLPLITRFRLAFASVPKILRDVNNSEFPEFIRQQRGAFVVGNYIDQRSEAHIFDVKSAPIAIPVAVDQIFTAQVLT